VINTEYLLYLAYGYAFLAAIISIVRADSLWKPRVFKSCLYISLPCAGLGLIMQTTDLQYQLNGATLMIMFFPIVFLGYFQLIRQVFKKLKGTEPYITTSVSSVGQPPLDLFDSSNKDGKKRKFAKDRKIMLADFVFSFAFALVPALSLMLLMAWIYGRL